MANGLMVDPLTGVVYDAGASAAVPVAAPTVQAAEGVAVIPATRPTAVRPVAATVAPSAPAGLAYTPEGDVMLDPGAPLIRQRAAYTPATAEGGGVDRIGRMIQDAAGRLWAQVSAIPSALGIPSRAEVREPVDIVAANAAMPFGDPMPAPTGGFARRLPEDEPIVLQPIVVSAEAAEPDAVVAEEAPQESATPARSAPARAEAAPAADNRPRPEAAGPARPQSDEERKVAALVQMYELAASAGFLDTERTSFKDFVSLFRARTALPEEEAAPQQQDPDREARQRAFLQGMQNSSEGRAGMEVTNVPANTPAPEPQHRTVQSAPQPMNTEADARGA